MLKTSRTILLGIAVIASAFWASAGYSRSAEIARPKLCAPLVVNECYVGYVTPTGALLVLLSTKDNDPLVSLEVPVSSASPDAPFAALDLSRQIGSIIMLDAVGKHATIYSARIVSTAEPIFTALYMATILKVPPDEPQQ